MSTRCGRKRHSPLAEVWLHGKLLYALMLERRMRRQLGDSWGRLDHERVGTWWRVWGMLKDEIAPMITGALFWKEDAWAACLKVLVERPRRRTLQQLPPAGARCPLSLRGEPTRGHAHCSLTAYYPEEPMLYPGANALDGDASPRSERPSSLSCDCCAMYALMTSSVTLPLLRQK